MQRILAALAALFLGLAQPAQAQDFPNRTINMIVVFAPGGATDVLARIVADHMMKTLNQRVTVENISGAGGTIGGARRTGGAGWLYADRGQPGEPFGSTFHLSVHPI